MDNRNNVNKQIYFDNIEIYVDNGNPDNVWGIINYNEFTRHTLTKKQEIIRFINQQAMIDYVRTYFSKFKLNNTIEIDNKQVIFHFVDYSNIKCLYYDGKPNLNHIEITYQEYSHGKPVKRTISFPKEYEDMFIEILKISKRIPLGSNLDSRYQKDVDVYQERSNNRKELLRSITMSFDEFFMYSGKKIREIKDSGKLKNHLKVYASITSLIALLATGYALENKNKNNSEYLNQYNGVKNVQDVLVYINKGNNGVIIEKLMNGEYEEVSPDEINGIVDFIRQIEERNYDNNDSFNVFNYGDYFKYKVGDAKSFSDSSDILDKIERLYRHCFEFKSSKCVLNQEAVKKYIDYVASLSFMYDTYHTYRPVSYVSIETQSVASSYATSDEIEIYDSYPPILRYIILNQLKNVLIRSNYEVKDKPSYYFNDTDKYGLLTEINKKMDNILDEMYFQCGYQRGNKR